MDEEPKSELFDFAEYYVRNVLNESTQEIGVLKESKKCILIELIKLEIKNNGLESISDLKPYLESDFKRELKILLNIDKEDERC